MADRARAADSLSKSNACSCLVRLPIAARLPPLSCWLVQQRGINDGKRGAQPVIEGYLLVPATPLRGRLKGNFSSIASLRGGRSIFPRLAGKVI